MLRCPPPSVRAQASKWWDKAECGGTHAEVLVLALLVVRDEVDAELSKWVTDVLADADGYVDGAPWEPPESWRLDRRHIPKAFDWLVEGVTLPIAQGVAHAVAQYGGDGRTAHISESQVKKYVSAMRSTDRKQALVGLGFGLNNRNPPKRATYLAPRVARLVRHADAARRR